MPISIEQLIAEIHQSPTRLVLAVAGGGSGAVARLLEMPGASRTVLEAIVPYSANAMIDWLGGVPDQFCAEETARAMAMAAYRRALRLADGDTVLAGVGVTASLASDRPKRGRHRIHLAIQTDSRTKSVSLGLNRGHESRAEEEWIVGRMVINGVAEACGLDGRLDLELREDERTDESSIVAPRSWQDLLAGKVDKVRHECAARPASTAGQASSGTRASTVRQASSGTRASTVRQASSGTRASTVRQASSGTGASTVRQASSGTGASTVRQASSGTRASTVKQASSGTRADVPLTGTSPLFRPAARVIFPGAFNPIHRGHRGMIEIAEEELGDPVELELSIVNVEKPPLDFIEIERRLAGIDPGTTVWLTRLATFEEKSRHFPGATFIVGADTLRRIADPRYYGDDLDACRRAIEGMAVRGCRFLVFVRQGETGFETLPGHELSRDLASICREIPAGVFCEDVSSTEIRRSGDR